MQRLGILSIPALAMALGTPAQAADLDYPAYRERRVTIEREAPVVERRIIERRYVEPAPVYERRVWVEPRVYYGPRRYAYWYDRPYRAYGFADWGRRGHGRWGHRRHGW